MGLRESKPIVKKGHLYSEVKKDLSSFDLMFFPPTKQVGMIVKSDILNIIPKDKVYLFYSSSKGIQLKELDNIVEDFDVKNENRIYYCKMTSPSQENKEAFRQVFSLYNGIFYSTYCGCFTRQKYSPVAFITRLYMDLRILPSSLGNPETVTVDDFVKRTKRLPRILCQDPVYITTNLHYDPVLSTNMVLRNQVLPTSYSMIHLAP